MRRKSDIFKMKIEEKKLLYSNYYETSKNIHLTIKTQRVPRSRKTPFFNPQPAHRELLSNSHTCIQSERSILPQAAQTFKTRFQPIWEDSRKTPEAPQHSPRLRSNRPEPETPIEMQMPKPDRDNPLPSVRPCPSMEITSDSKEETAKNSPCYAEVIPLVQTRHIAWWN